jgi:hypothetical protein
VPVKLRTAKTRRPAFSAEVLALFLELEHMSERSQTFRDKSRRWRGCWDCSLSGGVCNTSMTGAIGHVIRLRVLPILTGIVFERCAGNCWLPLPSKKGPPRGGTRRPGFFPEQQKVVTPIHRAARAAAQQETS